MKTATRIPYADAIAVANELSARLEGAAESIAIAGSLRRQRPTVGDIEILAIPRFEAGIVDLLDLTIKQLMAERVLDYRPNALGHAIYGPLNKLLLHVPSGFPVDIFSTDRAGWPVALVVRTGPAELNRRIAGRAIEKGWRFLPYGPGFQAPDGIVHCHTEQEVFEAVGLPYREPWERD